MSFKYQMSLVTMENYRQIFGNNTPDILDEIRSAVLDDTPIANFIACCGDDSYKLGQFRMALREYVPPKYLNKCLTGKHINLIRQIYSKRGESGLSMLSDYLKSFTHYSFTEEAFCRILEVVLHGGDISKIDFGRVQTSNISVVCNGIEKGYPMWLCAEEPLSSDMMRLMIQGMLLGIDIHPFLVGEWSTEVVTAILTNANVISVAELLSWVTDKFSVGEVQEVMKAMRFHLDWTLLCAKNSDGEPLFNEYQMAIISQCLIADVLTEDIYNPRLSDIEMQDKYMNAVAAKAKSVSRFGGSLKHGREVKK